MKKPEIRIHPVSKLSVMVLSIVSLFAGMASPHAEAQPTARMGVSPQRYHIEFGAGGSETQSLMVQNLTDQPMTVKLSVNYWELDDTNRVKLLPPAEDTLDGWIVINPLRVTIPPNSPQTIRWAIMPRLMPEENEYRAMIFVEEELPARESSEGTNLRVKMRYGLPVYAQVGNPAPRAVLHSVHASEDGRQLQFDISNEGDAHGRMSGRYGVWPLDEYPGEEKALQMIWAAAEDSDEIKGYYAGQLPDSAVLPGYRRTLNMNINLPQSGEYILQLDARFAQLHIKDAIRLNN